MTEAQWKQLEHDEFVHLFPMWETLPDNAIKATASCGTLFYDCVIDTKGTILLYEFEFHTACRTQFRFDSSLSCMTCIDIARRKNPAWIRHKRLVDKLNNLAKLTKKLNEVTI